MLCKQNNLFFLKQSCLIEERIAVFAGLAGFLHHAFVDNSVENVDNSLKNNYVSLLCNSVAKEQQFEKCISSAIFWYHLQDKLSIIFRQ